MPFLVPPPDFKTAELEEHGLLGTCELQICRSAGPWSLGTPAKIEHSIQTAYLKGKTILFVYIETNSWRNMQLFNFRNTSFTSRTNFSSLRKSAVDGHNRARS